MLFKKKMLMTLMFLAPVKYSRYSNEQKIDVVNEDILSPESFLIYEKKRLYRKVEYMKIRH